MEWHKLELSKASLIKKEVDFAISQLNDSTNTNADSSFKSNLAFAIQSRIQELETFYIRNNDDERAILFEKERLRLRKALQTFNATFTPVKDSKSVTGTASVGALSNNGVNQNINANNSVTTGQNNLKTGEQRVGSSNQHTPRVSRITTPLGYKSRDTLSMNSVTNKRFSPTSTTPKIYAWEEGNNNHTKEYIQIDNAFFVPTSTNGFYNRTIASPIGGQRAFFPNNNNESSNDSHSNEMGVLPMSDKYCDFQIVLTLEELTTLASRKKSEVRSDSKLDRSKAASMSVHSTTPYIENRRIVNSMLRPAQPNKWINPEGMRAYKHN